MTVTPGIFLNPDNSVQIASRAGVFTISGGNGGDSDTPGRSGGKGGNLTISKEFLAIDVRAADGSRVNGFGNGGRGFNGCTILPCTVGSAGGKGGNLFSVIYFAANKAPNSFNGGKGGDGLVTPGDGGVKGEKTGGEADITPRDGDDGVPCPAITGPGDGYLAVVLDFDLGTDLKRGDTVPLYRIQGGRIGNAEPITDTSGCSSSHFHGSGIFIRGLKAGRWIDLGPFSDPNGSRCGYGAFIVTTNKEIQSATGLR